MPFPNSPSFSNGNGNVNGDLLPHCNANDNGGAVEDDNAAAAAAFPTHHTIIVPAPMDVRRDRNSRSGRVRPGVHYVWELPDMMSASKRGGFMEKWT